MTTDDVGLGRAGEVDRLARARDEADRHHVFGGWSTASSPDERTVPSILAGILDALIVIADSLHAPPAVPPGSCWHDSGFPVPGVGVQNYRCTLLAGHAGAHEADRGSLGGTATWTDEEARRG